MSDAAALVLFLLVVTTGVLGLIWALGPGRDD